MLGESPVPLQLATTVKQVLWRLAGHAEYAHFSTVSFIVLILTEIVPQSSALNGTAIPRVILDYNVYAADRPSQWRALHAGVCSRFRPDGRLRQARGDPRYTATRNRRGTLIGVTSDQLYRCAQKGAVSVGSAPYIAGR